MKAVGIARRVPTRQTNMNKNTNRPKEQQRKGKSKEK